MIRYVLYIFFREKLRTFLTSLGVTIAVILLSLIIFGMQSIRQLFANEFSSRFKPNEVVVMKTYESENSKGLSKEETEYIKSKLLTPKLVQELKTNKKVVSITENMSLNMFDLDLVDDIKKELFSPVYIMGWNVIGTDSYFTKYIGEERIPRSGEVIVSNKVAEYYDLKPEDLIGKNIELKPTLNTLLFAMPSESEGKIYNFKIIGVFDVGVDRLDVVMNLDRSLEILSETYGFKNVDEFIDIYGYDILFIQTKSKEDVKDYVEFLKNKYDLKGYTSDNLLEFLDVLLNGLTLLLIIFSIISFVVAAIGIINTMVMNIHEQTREIGIIKAIGGSNNQIFTLFIMQSGLIGLFGGGVGLYIVYLFMKYSDPIIVKLLENEGFTTQQFFTFNFEVAFFITIASIVVGVVSGLYPAMKAAKYDPVKALRYE